MFGPLKKSVLHWDATHVWLLVQAIPQAPQLFESLVVSMQVPLQIMPAQAWQPLAEQCWPEGQTIPQLPQLLSLWVVSTQVPLQFVLLCAGHGSKQTPDAQDGCEGGHTSPQPPQFWVSVPLVSVQVPPQSALPWGAQPSGR